jgi:predicted amidohydrolase YtcJ
MNRPRRRLAALRIGVVCLGASLVFGPTPWALGATGTADLVLLHGKIVTGDRRYSIGQAVAIQQDRIAGVGTDAQMQAYAGPRTRVIDLRGRTVIPGLIDSHIHAVRAGLTYNYELGWQTVTSLAQGLKLIRDQAARTPPGTWLVVAGGWHESQFAENRKPKPEEIEAISSDHPIWVQYLNDDAILNKAALNALGLTTETKDPVARSVLRDASGQPIGITGTGPLTALYLKIPRPPLDAQITSTRDWFRELNRVGLTDIGDAAGGGLFWPEDYRAVGALHERGELTLRVHWYMQPNGPGGELNILKRFLTTVRPGSGDDWVRPVGVGEQLVAAVSDGNPLGPLPPQFAQKALEDWRTAVRMTIESGWRFHAHASRNHSVEQLLPAIEEINREIPVGNRRLAFAHVEDVTIETIRRIKALGGGITVQDRLMYTGDEIVRNWPEEVFRSAPRMKTMLAMGLPMGGGTDATHRVPYNPFWSLWWMITGKTVAGHPVRGPQETLSRLQALRVYTLGSAWFNMDEDKVGSIEPGKYADLVVLSADYLTVPVDTIKDLVSLLTIVGGKPVYAAGDYKSVVPR